MPEPMLWTILLVAASPFIYYLLAIYGSMRFFLRGDPYGKMPRFTPPVSNFKTGQGSGCRSVREFREFVPARLSRV